ncbi:unnamed protein product, partial [Meganyctiphanes norvegica]
MDVDLHFKMSSLNSIYTFIAEAANMVMLDDVTEEKMKDVSEKSEKVEVPTSKKPMQKKPIYNRKKRNCTITPLGDNMRFFTYLSKPSFTCSNKMQMGGHEYHRNKRKYIDGDKWVCLDSQYNITPNDCLVYSFGINNEWSFDDSMDAFGCKVFAFDPTMRMNNHQRSDNIQFWNLGLSKLKGTKYIDGRKCKVDRFENILRMLGHLDKDIDYLKMDIEGAELEFFNDVFSRSTHVLANIKQIGMEIHPGNQVGSSAYKRFWKYFQLLECYGFHLTFSNPNSIRSNHFKYKGMPVATCYELVWTQNKTW